MHLLRRRGGRRPAIVRQLVGAALALVGAWAFTAQVRATNPPQSFDPLSLPPGFTQELYGASSNLIGQDQGLFGGVAFNGSNPVVAECLFTGTQLHEFLAATETHPTGAPPNTQALHVESIKTYTDPAPPTYGGQARPRGFGGCGIVNHPNGKIYANLDPSNGFGEAGTGVAEIDPSTWTVTRYFGPAGSALGIAVDPATMHLVYIGQDCEQNSATGGCTLWDVDPAVADGDPHVFLQTTVLHFIDGIYFAPPSSNPADNVVFLAGRVPDNASNGLTVVLVSDPAPGTTYRTGVVHHTIDLPAPPDGVSFHGGSDRFIVTNNNDGTLSKVAFPSTYLDPPLAPSAFASGGFRGDLTQVGPDHCIYVTQSWGSSGAPLIPNPDYNPGDPDSPQYIPDPAIVSAGTRYDDGSTTTETSLVRICEPNGPGFVSFPGVARPRLTLAKQVTNTNGGTALATDWTLSAAGTEATISGVTGDAAITSAEVPAGTYALSETGGPSGYTASAWSCVSTGTQIPFDAPGGNVTLVTGNDVTCTITNRDQPGHLTIIKHVINDNGGTSQASAFSLTATGTAIADGSQTVAGSEAGVTIDVKSGSFDVTESPVAGYTQTSAIGCAGTIAVGGSATCTITNDDDTPTVAHLIVNKVVVNDNGGILTAASFSGTITGAVVATGGNVWSGATTDKTLTAFGAYNVTENSVNGYTASYSADCTGTIAAGQTKTCTVTNDDQPSHLKLVKTVTNDNGGSATPAAFTLSATGPTPLSGAGSAESDVSAGSYTLAETNLSGYAAGPWSCVGGSLTGNTLSLTVGQSATCTINNDDQPAHLIVNKVVVGGILTPAAFAGTIGGTIVATGGNTWAGASTDRALTAVGSYSVAETPVAGYEASFSADCTGTIAIGETKTCTVTNTLQVGSIKIVKTAVGGDGSFSFTSNFGVSSLTTTSGSASQTVANLATGNGYSIAEVVPAGWTLSGASCDNGSLVSNITVAANQTTTCTFVNTRNTGSIKIVKTAVGGNGTFTFTSTFGVSSLTTASGTASQTVAGLTVGAGYSIAEVVPTGWTLSGASCDNGSPVSNITVTANQTTTCTFVNTKRGTLVVQKTTIPASDPTSFAITASPASGIAGSANGTVTDATDYIYDVASGIYSVTETVPTGWSQTSNTCVNVTVAAGGTSTCVITNTKQPAYVTYTQGGWGAVPSGNNPGMLLQTNFSTVYPTCASKTYAPTTTSNTCVTIGIVGQASRYFARFTSSAAIQAFLPAGGTPKALKSPSLNNPTTTPAGVFAGQVLALQLAVDFSNRGITTGGLAGLHVVAGNPMAGSTVQDVLNAANTVLGGGSLPAGISSVGSLNDLVTRINENFDGGTVNNGLLQ